MKIAVTAASGKLGAAIINRLKKETAKENVIGIARTPENALHLDVEIRKGDYNSKDDLLKSFVDIDAVLLVSGMDDPKKRIQQHRNVIEAAKECGVKKIVYTGIIGEEKGSDFSQIVQSNRQTEEDIKSSGLNWSIGRNGLYIEPDLEYIDKFKKQGGLINSGADGKTSYTSREELAYAYAKMLTQDKHNEQIYNLTGEAITQAQLAEKLNIRFKTDLSYKSISVEEFTKKKKGDLGEFMGTVIGGIYEGIRNGDFNVESDFEKAAGRKHKSASEIINEYKEAR